MSKHSGTYAHEQSPLDAQLDAKLNALRNPQPVAKPVQPAKPPVQVVRIEQPEMPIAEQIMLGAAGGILGAGLFLNRNPQQW
jgi:hypothetical protein